MSHSDLVKYIEENYPLDGDSPATQCNRASLIGAMLQYDWRKLPKHILVKYIDLVKAEQKEARALWYTQILEAMPQDIPPNKIN
jgi:hypothetical protein